jgi:hypothetical protein
MEIRRQPMTKPKKTKVQPIEPTKPINPIVATLQAIKSNEPITTPDGRFILNRLYRRAYIMGDVATGEYSLNSRGESLLRQMIKEGN